MKKREAILALREAQLEKGHLRNTRICYRGWLVRYIDGAAAGKWSDLQGFLTFLASDPHERVSPKTVKQALNAMVFFYKNVLSRDPETKRVTLTAAKWVDTISFTLHDDVVKGGHENKIPYKLTRIK